jgi:hypothetical protein
MTRLFGAEAGQSGRPRPGPTQCHDITVYPAIGLAGGACEGYGLLLDIRDPADPRRVAAVADSNFSYWHSATFNNDGTKVLFSDEWGGGGAPKCRATDPKAWGADAIFTVGPDRKLTFQSYYKLPAAQTAQENCVAHNGSLVPIPGRDVMAQSWYQGGVSVFDFTDAKRPREIAFFDRGPVDSTRMGDGGTWSVYWYNGVLVSSEISRGLDVMELLPSAELTRNELDAAKTVRLDYLNAQGQPKFVWPASFALARAYVDQLERSRGPASGRGGRPRAPRSPARSARRAPGGARRSRGSPRRSTARRPGRRTRPRCAPSPPRCGRWRPRAPDAPRRGALRYPRCRRPRAGPGGGHGGGHGGASREAAMTRSAGPHTSGAGAPGTHPLGTPPAAAAADRADDVRRRVESHGLSHAGLVRPANEDHFVVASLQRSVQVRQTNLEDPGVLERLCGPMAYVFAVADGVGGVTGGAMASGLAVASIVEYLSQTVGSYHAVPPGQEHDFLGPLTAAVERAHERLRGTFAAATGAPAPRRATRPSGRGRPPRSPWRCSCGRRCTWCTWATAAPTTCGPARSRASRATRPWAPTSWPGRR